MIYTAQRGETMDDLLMRLGLDYCDAFAVQNRNGEFVRSVKVRGTGQDRGRVIEWTIEQEHAKSFTMADATSLVEGYGAGLKSWFTILPNVPGAVELRCAGQVRWGVRSER